MHKKLRMLFIYNQKYGGYYRVVKNFNIPTEDIRYSNIIL